MKSKTLLKMPYSPMEALLVDQLPEGPEWQYEPKWDGFRCLVFKNENKIALQSKAGRSLNRYFPELLEAVAALKSSRLVLDGEIVSYDKGRLDFDQLLQRIHPAASRVKMLASKFPVHFMAFDLLSQDRNLLVDLPLSERRMLLENFARKHFTKSGLIQLSPMKCNLVQAKQWLEKSGSFFDGIIAKRRDLAYSPGKRDAMQKFKPRRTADCVVGGFRYASNSKVVGSLLLGLYDNGLLHHVGFTSGLSATERKKLVKKLKPLIGPPGFTGRAPGGPSRWNTDRTITWIPLKPLLVVEVSFDHVTADRFRHGTKLLRWRPDKSPKQCKMEQIK